MPGVLLAVRRIGELAQPVTVGLEALLDRVRLIRPDTHAAAGSPSHTARVNIRVTTRRACDCRLPVASGRRDAANDAKASRKRAPWTDPLRISAAASGSPSAAVCSRALFPRSCRRCRARRCAARARGGGAPPPSESRRSHPAMADRDLVVASGRDPALTGYEVLRDGTPHRKDRRAHDEPSSTAGRLPASAPLLRGRAGRHRSAALRATRSNRGRRRRFRRSPAAARLRSRAQATTCSRRTSSRRRATPA